MKTNVPAGDAVCLVLLVIGLVLVGVAVLA